MTDRIISRNFVSDVGELLDMDRDSTIVVVDTLKAAGLLGRTLSIVEKRMHALTLTDAGKKTFRQPTPPTLPHSTL